MSDDLVKESARELPAMPILTDSQTEILWKGRNYDTLRTAYSELAARLWEVELSNAAHHISGNEMAELGKEWQQRAEQAEYRIAIARRLMTYEQIRQMDAAK